MMQGDLFEGRLVRLTAPRPDDAEEMARWAQRSEYLRNVDTDWAVPQTAEQIRSRGNAWRSHNAVEYRIRTLADDSLVGFIALFNMEWNNQSGMLAMGIGDPANRGKGYGTDALRVMLRYAFQELNLHRVFLDVIAYNEAAIRAYERVGFVLEGRMREGVYRDGKRYDRLIMGILRPDWERSHV